MQIAGENTDSDTHALLLHTCLSKDGTGMAMVLRAEVIRANDQVNIWQVRKMTCHFKEGELDVSVPALEAMYLTSYEHFLILDL